MGTRSSTGFIHQGKYIGVYNQFDGYFEGVGKEVVDTLREILNPDEGITTSQKLERLKERMIALKPVTDETPPTLEEQSIYKKAGFCNLRVSRQTVEDWYCLLRELQGARWLTEAYKGNLFHILDGSSFPKDSVFCEYAYAINFDTNMLEMYRGFQKRPQEGNIFGTAPDKSGYYPCAKVIEFPLTDIPDKWMELAYSAMKTDEDE